jgi:hypothetical protein
MYKCEQHNSNAVWVLQVQLCLKKLRFLLDISVGNGIPNGKPELKVKKRLKMFCFLSTVPGK